MSDAFVSGVLRKAEREIRGAANRTRNNTLFRQAAWVLEYVHGGELTRDLAISRLTEAAGAAGLSFDEIRSTLRSAEQKARNAPRTRPDRDAVASTDRAPTPPPPPPKYPPLEAVEEIVELGDTLLTDDEVCVWLAGSRHLDPVAVHRLGRVRVLSPKRSVSDAVVSAVPKRTVDGARRLVPAIGYRLMFPLVNPLGRLRSVVFRRCFDTDDPNLPKSMSLIGARKRLVMANRPALALLRRDKSRAQWWRDRSIEVVIAEGETDYLQACIEPTDAVRAVFGIFAGSWCESIAQAIPDDTETTIAVDDDDEGEKFTNQILRTMRGRPCVRWKPKAVGQDLNDAAGLRGGQFYETQ